MKITDFYGEKIRSKYNGEGTLTSVLGEDIHIKYDNGESYFYESNVFESGHLEFLNPELLEKFNKAYEEYTRSESARIEIFTKWLHRD